MCNNTQLLHEKEEARINLAMRAARPTSIIFFFTQSMPCGMSTPSCCLGGIVMTGSAVGVFVTLMVERAGIKSTALRK